MNNDSKTESDYIINEDYSDKLLQESLRQLEFKSVLDFISNFAATDLGRDVIIKSLPTSDLIWLRLEHELIGEMVSLLMRDTVPSLYGISDIKTKLYKSMIENAILNSGEVLVVSDTIRVFRTLKSFFTPFDEQFPKLFKVTRNLYENKVLEKHINDAIDDNGDIKDSATRELYRIRTEIRAKSQRLRDRLQKILKKVTDEDIAREDFYSIREGRFVLPIKVENKRALPGIIHGLSQTGSTVFVEPSEIIEMNNELSLLQNDERKEIYKILANLTSEIGNDAQFFLSSLDIASHVDSIIGKAKYAYEYGGVKPEIMDENYIYLSDIRHPILVHSKGRKRVIPMTIEFTPDKRGHLISGPNAGGKTVALKSVGLNIMMALSGIFSLGTCKTNFRYVYSSIGDQQSIENDLSTFSSQMLRLKNIVSACNQDSLILVDEIGSGTDPQEGAALACGILDTFLNIKLFFVATTHQSSLKTYALTREEIVNASLEFDDVKLIPTYKFLTGIPGNSYAFILAESIGLPKHIIERSRTYLGNRQTELEQSISVLQKYRAEAHNNAVETAELKAKFEALKKEYDSKLKDIKLKKSEIIGRARTEAGIIVNNANALIENTIRQIKEDKKTVNVIKTEFHTEKDKIEKEAEQTIITDDGNNEPIQNLHSGDYVMMPGSIAKGAVIEADDKQKVAMVEFNGFKMKLPYNQLQIAKEEKKKSKEVADFIKFDVKARVDVRGLRADETLRIIDDFVSEAVVNNLDMLTIVHGKGTGALKMAIHSYLKEQPEIKSYRLGDLVEGGAGVTIVELK
jgi:DNA mismatch repair protein MutS2